MNKKLILLLIPGFLLALTACNIGPGNRSGAATATKAPRPTFTLAPGLRTTTIAVAETPPAAAPQIAIAPSATPPPPEPATYTIKAGDTLFSVANKFGLTVDELAKANGIRDPNLISVGQVLTIPGRQATPAPAQPTAAPAPTQPAASRSVEWPTRMASPEYGMQAFLWWRAETADRDLNLIKDAGFGWVKQSFPWREMEGTGKGQYDWSVSDRVVQMAHDRFGLGILARVDSQPNWARQGCSMQGPPTNAQDYADFLRAMATRYRGKIRAYEVWNEPNLAREWCDQNPDPAEYARLLKLAYQAIKQGDPNTTVISAGLSPTGGPMPIAMDDTEYLDKMYQAMGGSSEGYFDVLGVHGSGFKAPPEMSGDEVMANPDVYGHGRWFTFRHVEDLRAVMEKYGDSDTQVAVLEFGWTVDDRPDSPYNWHHVSEEEQADYFVRAYKWAGEHWKPWIGLMNLIYVCNPDWTREDEQYYWCITEPNYPQTITRLAYDSLKAMPK